jgi:DNA-binding XRE family transcriptional regulator
MTIQRLKISSAQIRAARALLGWSARELAKQAGVSQSTIHRAETAKGVPHIHLASQGAIQTTFEESGIEFLDQSGLRLRHLNGERHKLGHVLTNINR